MNMTASQNAAIKNLYQQLPKNLICFSHLRWDFVFQRPQHLLTRFAETFQVFFREEPIYDSVGKPYFTSEHRAGNIQLMVPHLPQGLTEAEILSATKALFDDFMKVKDLSEFAFWYYTPMALEYTRKYMPELIIYDCMDELSAFKFAPESLKTYEQELLKRADVVFTGGHTLYEAKKKQHANIYPFPSSIDKKHFEQARQIKPAHSSPAPAPAPLLGFYGVIDERFDIDLIGEIAEARPNWQIMLIGPVVKIDEATLPKNSNICYLGPKDYKDLPNHLATWDIALIPFLLNESTRYISPTKTPEYLAAGVPVVSTPIRDVINPYGLHKLVSIAHNAEDFIAAIEKEMSRTHKNDWLMQVDNFLARQSWDQTCNEMMYIINKTITNRLIKPIAQ